MTKLQRYCAGVVAALVLVSVGYCRGRQDERLAVNSKEIKKSDAATAVVTAKADSTRKKSDALVAKYDSIKPKVRVSHDTVFVLDTIAVQSTEIAQRITVADSTIAAQHISLFAADMEILSLRVGVSVRDDRIKLLESAKTSRVSRGVQVGLGVCQSVGGTTPCAYVGYGLSFRL